MKNLFLSATRHHEGKTVLALGLIRVLARRGMRAGYFKPMGHGTIEAGEGRVDADAALMHDACGIRAPMTDVMPIVLDGFPADWMTREGRDHATERIRLALRNVSAGHEFVIVEATGNAATGSAFGLSNASLARLLDARVVIVSSGGVGQPADEVILNRSFYERSDVRVAGVVVNKVYPHEFDRLGSFLRPLLESSGCKLLGTVPFDEDLARPTHQQVLGEFRGQTLNGASNMRARLGRLVLGASTAAATLDQMEGAVTLLCPSDREEVLLAALGAQAAGRAGFRLQGVLFAGKRRPDERALALLRRTQVPAMHVELDAHSLASIIQSTAWRLTPADEERARRAEELVSKHVDVEALLTSLRT